jgi:hypothetical protein
LPLIGSIGLAPAASNAPNACGRVLLKFPRQIGCCGHGLSFHWTAALPGLAIRYAKRLVAETAKKSTVTITSLLQAEHRNLHPPPKL